MSTPETHIACFHCGDECRSDTLQFQGHHFCCEGCKTVYQLLDENGLCAYYDQSEQADRINKKPVAPRQFEFLETPEIAESFIQFQDQDQVKVEFFIPDMHCASCIWLLEKLYRLLPGVLYSRVNFDQKRLFISYDPSQLNLRQLVEKLSALGYEPALTKESDQRSKSKANRSLLIRLGVAGFCMGNIMLFSFPEYLGMDARSEQEFGGLFQWLSLLLALPVVFYSAQTFFVNAWKGLRSKQVNIDLPLAIGIATLFIRSTTEVLAYGEAGYFDSLSALVFFLLVGRWMQDKAYEAMSFERDYSSYFPVAVRKIAEDGQHQFLQLKDLKVGDRIRVLSQELIPADARIEKGRGQIDYSFVTGESDPQSVETGNRVYAGGRQTGGTIELTILKPVEQSYLTSLWNQHEMNKPHTGLKSFSNAVAKWFTLVLILLASGTLLYWYPIDQEIAFRAFTAVLIVACPCVLVIAAPFAFGNAMRWLSRKGIYLKNADVVEQVARIKRLAFDKTGTLSTGEQYASWNRFHCTDEELKLILSLAAANNHPMSKAIVNTLDSGILAYPVDQIKQVPGKGIETWIEDHHVKIGSAAFMDRVASGKTEVFASIDGEVKLQLILKPEYRPDLDKVLGLDLKNYPKVLISGDQDHERLELQRWFDDADMHFNSSPHDKLRILKKESEQGEVMMLGDGLNDAGALRSAAVGVAITDDINTFTPASDVIMVGKSISLLPKFLRFCNQTLKTVQFSFLFSLIYNCFWMYLAVQGLLSPLIASLLMPISSITVFSINTLGIRYFARKAGIQ